MISKLFRQMETIAKGRLSGFFSSSLLLTSLLPCVAGFAPVSAAEPVSGQYGPLALVVANRHIHGVFSEGRMGNGTSEAPQFSCAFLLEGRLEGNEATVETWFPGEPERISGTIRFGDEPGLQLADNHGGCLMASGDMVAEPFPLPLDKQHADWIGVGIVTTDKVVLQRAPKEDPARKRPFIVEFDSVAILERRPGWIRVVYLGGGDKPVSGWISDTAVVSSPGARP